MNCPRCMSEPLRQALTKKGVEVDRCAKCSGIWLDKGELYHFASKTKELEKKIQEGLQNARPSGLKSPKTGEAMVAFTVVGIELDQCPKSQGLWLDGGELQKIAASDRGIGGLETDESVQPDEAPPSASDPAAQILTPLPNLAIRSGGVILGLYALLVFGLIVLAELAYLPLSFALILGGIIIAIQFVLGPFFMDLTLRWCQKLHWVEPEELPKHLAETIERICKSQDMKVPRLGIIEDGNPNAFTYGHTPNNARLVLTRGILSLLQPDEMEGVVAHEIGHAKHWDMLVMTVAQLVPLILYYVYRTCMRSYYYRSSSRRSSSKAEGARIAVGIGALVLYIISQYLVLWLSRTREYFADRFAGNLTGKPGALASALVKIAYGMAGRDPKEGKGEGAERSGNLDAVGAMGLFDGKAARSLAITSSATLSKEPGLGGDIDREALQQAMRWDRWNPWAKYYELHSTHPLVANRLQYLGEQSASMNQKPFVLFNLKRPESYWDEFLVDCFFMMLPLLGAVLGLFWGMGVSAPGLRIVGLALLGWGIGALIKLPFKYPNTHFPEMSILSLLKKVKVSGVRPVPCTLEGTIIGRGVPGLLWSEDFVMKDNTGILFLDYRQPIPFWDFFFGLLRGAKFQGEPVTVTGWYRRAPVPYFELLTLTTKEGTRTCYTRFASLLGACVVVVAGLVLVFMNANPVV